GFLCLLAHAVTSSYVAFIVLAYRRTRRRGTLRSFIDSPTRVMPSTVSTMAMPGNTEVHHTPDVTSGSALLRSYPHSDAEVGSMPNPRNPSPARVRIASEELSVKISGSVRVALRKM